MEATGQGSGCTSIFYKDLEGTILDTIDGVDGECATGVVGNVTDDNAIGVDFVISDGDGGATDGSNSACSIGNNFTVGGVNGDTCGNVTGLLNGGG
ncbi:hypothetical protein EB077_06520 [bacterium]|nr:hypothetical protein [bacterium]